MKELSIVKTLFDNSDKEYAIFQAHLTPSVNSSLFIGVRVPTLRKIAKEYYKNDEAKIFLTSLPHKYYDENMLHSLLLLEVKDYNQLVKYLDDFLPFVDNWAVCDTIIPKILNKHRSEIRKEIIKWMKSDKEYTIRFGIKVIMNFFLDEYYDEELMSIASSIRSDFYYVNMMKAWLFAEALTKNYDKTINYIERKALDKWSHNKSIQKAIESYRIGDNIKEYLRSLKIK